MTRYLHPNASKEIEKNYLCPRHTHLTATSSHPSHHTCIKIKFHSLKYIIENPTTDGQQKDAMHNTHITIFLLAIAEAAAKSRGDGKSPKLVNSDHCHISVTQTNSIDP